MRTAFLILGLAVAHDAGAQARPAPHAAHRVDASAPPGAVQFGVSCARPARAEFDRGVTLLHHMTYPRAREAFERVTTIDAHCAMAHWGVAMTLFQPLWPTRPSPAELQRGWRAVQAARALGLPTPRESLLVNAAAAFFEAPESPDYWLRVRRWQAGMALAHAAFPADDEVSAFHALALLAVAPQNSVSTDHADQAADLLVDVHDRRPGHPGAMHYIVHARDVPGREGRSLPVVRRYDASAPRNPHALHMPTHIYTRLGDWDAVISGNRRAADAALEYPAGDSGQFVWDEFPHAIEYLVYAALQQGADGDAARQLQRLLNTPRLQPSFKTAFHLASTSARYALERHAWREAMQLVPRSPATLDWDRFTWPEAVTWFAKGLGAVHEGDTAAARAAIDRLQALERAAGTAGEELFTRNIRVMRLEVSAWLAQYHGDASAGVSLLQQAADLEVATPKHAVTPAPTVPAHELLGDLLMVQRRPADALTAYERALTLHPRRFNALLGAARAARAAGNTTAARAHYRQLLAVGARSTRAAILAEARAAGERKASARSSTDAGHSRRLRPARATDVRSRDRQRVAIRSVTNSDRGVRTK